MLAINNGLAHARTDTDGQAEAKTKSNSKSITLLHKSEWLIIIIYLVRES